MTAPLPWWAQHRTQRVTASSGLLGRSKTPTPPSSPCRFFGGLSSEIHGRAPSGTLSSLLAQKRRTHRTLRGLLGAPPLGRVSSAADGQARVLGRPGEEAPPPSVHELSVALGPGDDDIHPDAHGFCRRGHHVVQPVVGLHAEGEGWVWALPREEDGLRQGPRVSCLPTALAPPSSGHPGARG